MYYTHMRVHYYVAADKDTDNRRGVVTPGSSLLASTRYLLYMYLIVLFWKFLEDME